MESIIVALITGGLALIGVVYTNSQSNKKMEQQLATSQAVMDTKIQNLTDEVKRHNEFWMKIPAIETRIEILENDIKEIRKNEQ